MSLAVPEEINAHATTAASSMEYWRYGGELFDPDIAEAAGALAIGLLRRPELSFVSTLNGDRTTRYLGIWQPRGPRDWGTIRAHPGVMEYLDPLVQAIDLSIADDEILSRCTHVLMRCLRPRSSIPRHQDMAGKKSIEKRRIVNLTGHSVVTCISASTSQSEAFHLSPGTGYDLHITDDPQTTPWHSAEAIGRSPRVTLMFTELQALETMTVSP